MECLPVAQSPSARVLENPDFRCTWESVRSEWGARRREFLDLCERLDNWAQQWDQHPFGPDGRLAGQDGVAAGDEFDAICQDLVAYMRRHGMIAEPEPAPAGAEAVRAACRTEQLSLLHVGDSLTPAVLQFGVNKLWRLWRAEFGTGRHAPTRPRVRTVSEALDAIDLLLSELPPPAEESAGAARGDAPAPPVPPASPRVRWDATTRQLFFDDEELKTYGRRAPAQFAVLDAFEEAGWPPSIKVKSSVVFSVKDTVESLNKILLPISCLRFERGPGDATIRWHLTPV
jgi:hypothetical protein